MGDFSRYLATPEDRAKLPGDLDHLHEAVSPHITGSKRVPVRVAALRRVLAAYEANCRKIARDNAVEVAQ